MGLSQQTSRTLQFTQLQTPQNFMETATVIRSTGEIRSLKVEASQKTMALQGDTGQIALADWLFTRLDRLAGSTTTPQAAQLDYRPTQDSDDIVRVFYFKNPAPLLDLQKMTTVIRSLTEIPRAFLSNAAGAFVIRGTQEQMDAANWLFESLDQSSFVDGTTNGHITDSAGENTIHLFSVPRFGSEQELQNFASEMRVAAQMKRVYTYYPLRVIAVRGTPAQIEQAARLASKL